MHSPRLSAAARPVAEILLTDDGVMFPVDRDAMRDGHAIQIRATRDLVDNPETRRRVETIGEAYMMPGREAGQTSSGRAATIEMLVELGWPRDVVAPHAGSILIAAYTRIAAVEMEDIAERARRVAGRIATKQSIIADALRREAA